MCVQSSKQHENHIHTTHRFKTFESLFLFDVLRTTTTTATHIHTYINRTVIITRFHHGMILSWKVSVKVSSISCVRYPRLQRLRWRSTPSQRTIRSSRTRRKELYDTTMDLSIGITDVFLRHGKIRLFVTLRWIVLEITIRWMWWKSDLARWIWEA